MYIVRHKTMKKLTPKQLDALCVCGHERREHSDDIEGNETIKVASEFCMYDFGHPYGGHCKCRKFRKAIKN